MNSQSFAEAVKHLVEQLSSAAGHLEEYPAVDQIDVNNEAGEVDASVFVYLKNDECTGGMPLHTSVLADEVDIEGFELALLFAAVLHKGLWALTKRVRALSEANARRAEDAR